MPGAISPAEPLASTKRALSSAGPALPELLAPAGDWDCAKAAVENGADAIYFGLEKFNARMRARNFLESDLPGLMEYLHRRGVKGYVTFNTLVFENELDQARQYLRALLSAGVDAAIVQDVGICRMIRELSPDFPIHVSTQMTVTSLAGVEFARRLGCNLVVLARECSLKEIENIQAAQRGHGGTPGAPGNKDSMPLEVFVHGALCVAYSGQCLTSEALGGRSANRGECAQACRMPYDLFADDKAVPLGDRKYLLSPQDLAGLEVLPELQRLGVTSLKIEGRLKSPEYVANITRIYRQALDRLREQTPVPPSRQDQYEMEMAFSRGLYPGWFRGINNQELVHARFGKKRGVYLGEVLRVEREQVTISLEAPLKPGDGIVFDDGHPEQEEEGGRVYTVDACGPGKVKLSFRHDAVKFERIQPGTRVWKTSDPELERRLRQTFERETPGHQRAVSFEVHGVAGKPMTVFFRDEFGHVARKESAIVLEQAQKQPLTTERLKEQFGRLGGTAFFLQSLDNQLEGSVILPVSALNQLRRELVQDLQALKAVPNQWTLAKEVPSLAKRPLSPAARSEARLVVLARNIPQMHAALEEGIQTVHCEFEDPKKYREAVDQFRAAPKGPADRSIFVAPPRISKTGEEWILKLVRSSEADGYLIRNYDHLEFFGGERCVGDFSLNIANHLAAEYFKGQFNLELLTPSYDLNFMQLEALLRAAPAEWFEVTVHQHMPMFHMEHCVFCAFLSDGTDYRNCGRPCDHHALELRDRVGMRHPVKADAGCRNTVFNAIAQTGAEWIPRMLELGVRHLRLEFLNETPAQVKQTIAKYRQLLKGTISSEGVWRELKLLNQLGVTRGQF